MSMAKSREGYWAASEDKKEVVAKIEGMRTAWLDQSISSGLFSGYVSAYWRNTVAYYSNLLTTNSWESSLEFAGVKGELIKMKIPLARTLIQQFVTLVTKQRLAFEALIDVDDAKPQMSARIGSQLAKYIVECESLDAKQETASELAATVGMSFYVTSWRSDRGSEYVPTDKAMLMTGGVGVDVDDIQNIMWDWTIKAWDNVPWAVTRRKQNRWDLIANVDLMTEVPEEEKTRLKDAIRALPSAEAERRIWNNLNFITGLMNDDMVYVYTLVHRRTPAMRGGRIMEFSNRDTIYKDKFENPYNGLPVEPVVFEQMKDTTLGYPLLSSLLPAQEMIDHSYSVSATNQSAFGVQAMLTPRGAGISVQEINGLKVVYYNKETAEGGGKPEPMVFPSTPPSIMQFAQALQKNLGDLSMLNDTLRGQPPPNVTSGAMAATLSANALEFLNKAQRANDSALEKTINHAVTAYKTFTDVPQIIEVTGDQSLGYSKEITAEVLTGIRRVFLKKTNPLLNTLAGRIQLGEWLLSKGLIKDPALLVSLLNGAPPEVLFKGLLLENLSVQSEIDALMEDREVFPLETDNHPLYIAAYKEILDNPIVRERTELPQTIVPLLQERLRMEMTMDPTLKAMLRGQPAPEQAPPAGGAGGDLSASLQGAPSGAAQPAAPAQPNPIQ